MKRLILIISIIIPLCFSSDLFAMDAQEEAVYKVVASHYKGINKGKAEDILKLFTDDVVMMAPYSESLIGKENVTPHSKEAHKDIDFDFTYKVEEIMIEGNLAVVRSKARGMLMPKVSDVFLLDEMKAVHVLKKQEDGKWKIARFIFNPSTPLK